MDNQGYELNGLSIFEIDPLESQILENDKIVRTFGDQTIDGVKTFESIIVNNEIIHNSTSF